MQASSRGGFRRRFAATGRASLLAGLVGWLLSAPFATGYTAAHSFVEVLENNTAGTVTTLDWKDDQHATGASASSDLSPHNSHLQGSSEIILNNAKRLFKVGVSMYLDTSSHSEPGPGENAATFYYVHANAEERDTLHIKMVPGHSNVTAHFVFQMYGGPLETSAPDVGSSATADAQLLYASNGTIMLNETGNSSGGSATALGIFDGSPQTKGMQVDLGFVGPDGVDLSLDVALWIAGTVSKFETAQSSADYLSSDPLNCGITLDNLRFTDDHGEIRDSIVIVTAQSGFDYLNAGSSRFLDEGQGKYGGLVVEQNGIHTVGGLFDAKVSVQKAATLAAPEGASVATSADAATLSFALTLNGQRFAGKGGLSDVGPVHFGTSGSPDYVIKRKNKPDLTLNLNVVENSGAYSLAGTLTEAGTGRKWDINCGHAIYTAAKNPQPPFQNVPAEMLGKYSVLLVPKTQVPALPASDYPQGDGWGLLTVSPGGRATLVGKLADGTPLSYGGALCEGAQWPFAKLLYHGQGSIGGVATFRDSPGASDLDAMNTVWTRPAMATAAQYPKGWPDGITVDLLGSHYAAPTGGHRALAFLNVAGNAEWTARDGGLSPSIDKIVTLTANNKVVPLAAGSDALRLAIAPGAGKMTGSFVPMAGSKTASALSGVIFQKQNIGAGFFLNAAQSGSFTLAANPFFGSGIPGSGLHGVKVPPVVKIKTPPAGSTVDSNSTMQITFAGSATVSSTAALPNGIGAVYYQVVYNGAPSAVSVATGTDVWSVVVTPAFSWATGTYTVYVKALDFYGNESALVSRSVQYAPVTH